MVKRQQAKSSKTLNYYCDLFSKIKVNKSKKRGEAPYKPILLLSIIDLITENELFDNNIPVSDSLVKRFDKYWTVLNPDSFNGGLALPFFHLKNDGFWKLKFSEKYDGGRPQTLPKLRHDVDYAILDQELFEILKDQECRQRLIDTLIAAWFASSKKQIEDILQMNDNLTQLIDQDDIEIENKEEFLENNQGRKTYLKKSIVRNAFFRKAIIHLYNYKCAICGLKVINSLNQSIIDGAHIKPLSLFYDNTISNGLSLCKNHHWAFDNGLLAINDDFKIIVSRQFEEESPNAKPLKAFNNECILLPEAEKHFPSLESIQWHRHNIFRT